MLLISSLALLTALNFVDGQSRMPIAKPKKLLMFAAAPQQITQIGPAISPSCVAAARIALESVNSDPNTLADYNIELAVFDEGLGGVLAPRQLITFLDRYQANAERYKQNNTYVAPMTLLGGFACNTWSGIVRYFNMVQFVHGCAGTLFTDNRVRFPNLYRPLSPAESTILPMASFAKGYGKWRQVAILSNSANSVTDLMSRQFYTASTRNGVEVVWFAGVPDIDTDVISSLKNSDARVIAVFIIEPPLYVKFACFAYQQGVTGSRYAFIVLWRSLVDPYVPGVPVPAGCTSAVLLEQIRITIFFGMITQQTTNFGPNALGIDLTEFENRYNQKINFTRFWDFDLRQQCHDLMLAAVFTLENGDRYLRSKFNLTLSDYDKYSETVMKAVNLSAASINIRATRLRRFAYSKRGEIDIEPVYVMQWRNRTLRPMIQYELKSPDLASSTTVNLDIYNVTLIESIIWATKSGAPPKDLSTVRVVRQLLPTYLMPTAWTVSFTLITSKMYPLIRVFQIMRRALKKEAEHAFEDFVEILGCLSLDIAAVLFSLDPMGTGHCFAQILVAAFGLSLLHGNNAFKLGTAAYVTSNTLAKLSFRRRRRKQQTEVKKAKGDDTTVDTTKEPLSRKGSLLVPSANEQSRPPHRELSPVPSVGTRNLTAPTTSDSTRRRSSAAMEAQIRIEEMENRNTKYFSAMKSMKFGSVCFMTLNIVAIGVWFGQEDAPGVVPFYSPIIYDNSDDSYYKIRTDMCFSPSTAEWLGSLAMINGLFLAMGSCFGIQIRKIPLKEALDSHLKFARNSMWNSTMLFIVLVLLQVVVPGGNAEIRADVLAFGSLLYSATNTVTIILAAWPQSHSATAANMHSRTSEILLNRPSSATPFQH